MGFFSHFRFIYQVSGMLASLKWPTLMSHIHILLICTFLSLIIGFHVKSPKHAGSIQVKLYAFRVGI